MKTDSSSGDHAAAVWSHVHLQHYQVLLIYTRITSHVAMVYARHFSASNNTIAAMMIQKGVHHSIICNKNQIIHTLLKCISILCCKENEISELPWNLFISYRKYTYSTFQYTNGQKQSTCTDMDTVDMNDIQINIWRKKM